MYRFEYNSIAIADLHPLFQSEKGSAGQRSEEKLLTLVSVASTLGGQLVVNIVESLPGRVEAVYILRSAFVKLVINGEEQLAAENDISKELGRGILVELTTQGRIVDFYQDPNTVNLSKDFNRTLLAAMQFVLPATPARDTGSWTDREENRNGSYVAKYTILSDSISKEAVGSQANSIVIRKAKVRYLPAPTQTAAYGLQGKRVLQRIVTTRGSFEGHFDPKRRVLASLEGTESEETAIQGKTIAHSDVTLRMTLDSMTDLLPPEMLAIRRTASTLKKDSHPLPLFAPRSADEIELNIQRSALGMATLEELLAQLAIVDAKRGKSEETSLYLKFKALIYVHPDSSVRLGAIMSGATASSLTFRILTGALGAVGHSEAQAALVRAIEARSDDWPALSSLIPTLGAVRRPTSEAEHAMRQLLSSSEDQRVSAAALLCLGSMAHNLTGSDKRRSAVIVDDLMKRSASSRTEDAKRVLAQALGNTSSGRAMPVLARFTNDASPAVRAAALDGLRSVALPIADKLLIHALGSDTDARVRLEAAFALGFRGASVASFEAERSAFFAEEDEKVRAALLNNLAKMHQDFPEVRKLIEQASEKDPSDYVRKVAREVLQNMPVGSSKDLRDRSCMGDAQEITNSIFCSRPCPSPKLQPFLESITQLRRFCPLHRRSGISLRHVSILQGRLGNRLSPLLLASKPPAR